MDDQHRRDDCGVDLAHARTADHHLPAIQRAHAENVALHRDFPAGLETRLNRRDLPVDAKHADDRLRLRRSREDREQQRQREQRVQSFLSAGFTTSSIES